MEVLQLSKRGFGATAKQDQATTASFGKGNSEKIRFGMKHMIHRIINSHIKHKSSYSYMFFSFPFASGLESAPRPEEIWAKLTPKLTNA